ncbi:MAG: HEAT repeat domain-containing protein [Candidatus Aminicenantes bacterium]|nr:HEAT repeat domain-containing protein [Candidatus Aminicenantes bacterium]
MILFNIKEWKISGLVGLSLLILMSPCFAQSGKGNYSLQGVVLDTQGNPVPDVKVVATLVTKKSTIADMEGSPFIWMNVVSHLNKKNVTARREVKTDKNGRWAIRLIQNGLWRLQAYSQNRISAVLDIMVRMNKNDIELVLTHSDISFLIEAKNAIYDSRWETAINILKLHEICFPKSKQLDNALYWLAFSKNKFSESVKERTERNNIYVEAIEDLDRLIAQFPESEWKDDGLILKIEIALRLVQMGQVQYRRTIREYMEIQELENVNIRLAALDAYRHIDKTEAVQILIDMARSHADPEARKKSVHILGGIGGKDIFSFLRKVAEEDPDESVRKAARIWLKY